MCFAYKRLHDEDEAKRIYAAIASEKRALIDVLVQHVRATAHSEESAREAYKNSIQVLGEEQSSLHNEVLASQHVQHEKLSATISRLEQSRQELDEQVRSALRETTAGSQQCMHSASQMARDILFTGIQDGIAGLAQGHHTLLSSNRDALIRTAQDLRESVAASSAHLNSAIAHTSHALRTEAETAAREASLLSATLAEARTELGKVTARGTEAVSDLHRTLAVAEGIIGKASEALNTSVILQQNARASVGTRKVVHFMGRVLRRGTATSSLPLEAHDSGVSGEPPSDAAQRNSPKKRRVLNTLWAADLRSHLTLSAARPLLELTALTLYQVACVALSGLQTILVRVMHGETGHGCRIGVVVQLASLIYCIPCTTIRRLCGPQGVLLCVFALCSSLSRAILRRLLSRRHPHPSAAIRALAALQDATSHDASAMSDHLLSDTTIANEESGGYTPTAASIDRCPRRLGSIHMCSCRAVSCIPTHRAHLINKKQVRLTVDRQGALCLAKARES